MIPFAQLLKNKLFTYVDNQGVRRWRLNGKKVDDDMLIPTPENTFKDDKNVLRWKSNGKEVSGKYKEKAQELLKLLSQKPYQNPHNPEDTKKFIQGSERISKLYENIQNNLYTPSSTSKEAQEKINKMLPTVFGIHIEDLNDKGSDLVARSMSHMAQEFPILFDGEVNDSVISLCTSRNVDAKQLIKEDNIPEHFEEFRKTPFFKEYYEDFCRRDVEESTKKYIDIAVQLDYHYNEGTDEEKRKTNQKLNDYFEAIYSKSNLSELVDKFVLSKGNPEDFMKEVEKISSDIGIKTDMHFLKLYMKKDCSTREAVVHNILQAVGNGKYTNMKAIITSFYTDPNNPANFESLMSRFVQKTMNDIDLYKKNFSSGTMGFSGSYGIGNIVSLNDVYNGSRDKEELKKYNYGYDNYYYEPNKPSFHPRGNYKCSDKGKNSIVYHELGHSLETRLYQTKYGSIRDKTITLKEPIEINGKKYKTFKMGEIFETIFNDCGKDYIDNNLSEYGSTNHMEMLAESMADFYCSDKPSDLAKGVVNLCKVLMQENLEQEEILKKSKPKKEPKIVGYIG